MSPVAAQLRLIWGYTKCLFDRHDIEKLSDDARPFRWRCRRCGGQWTEEGEWFDRLGYARKGA